MRRPRTARALFTVGIAVLAATIVGSGAAMGQSGKDPFGNLKKVEAPRPCAADPGIDLERHTIALGSVIPTSGRVTAFQQFIDGIEARLLKARSERELGKWQVEYANEDDGSDTARNLTAVQKLVEEDDVFALLLASTATTDGAGQYLHQRGVPVVGWHMGLQLYGKYPNFFGLQYGGPSDLVTNINTRHVEIIKALGGTKLALVGWNQASSVAFADYMENALEDSTAKGLTLAYRNTDVPIGSSDFLAVADQVKRSNADAIYTSMDVVSNAALARALDQVGANVPLVIFPSGYDQRVLAVPGMDKVYLSTEVKPFEVLKVEKPKGYREFTKWLQQYKPGVTETQLYAYGWLAANAMLEGIKAADPTLRCPTRKAFIANLRLEKNYDADGWFEPIDFRDTFNRPGQCVYYVQVVNGAFVPAFDGKEYCASKSIVDGKATKLTIPAAAYNAKRQ